MIIDDRLCKSMNMNFTKSNDIIVLKLQFHSFSSKPTNKITNYDDVFETIVFMDNQYNLHE